MEFKKEKKRMCELKKRFGVERISFEDKINSLELNAKMLLKQIYDFEQLIILECAKNDKEKKDITEECQSQIQKLSESIALKQKALDEEKKQFALEKRITTKKHTAIAKEFVEKEKVV